ncbi:putative undecaprenyl-phosphate N-acetylglucosaminyl 1-phosphate transferase [Pseudomonas reidholzensis]|uniref:Putative undecaprenyl-phosphate N-acetylglucosaminyl 1-phosphate transferase n=1 Tax=Pseudomonas reidholzensis TaxID=1785162 RepID=A0A383RRP7_9PSED|nr:glycosyltransferase family 4 protein [Pseudomonas reidholzensis]SYX89433.1 putative undecaprenyl-phosphate N-acetylglucosaminyl 1-phosphate transferase [Pseudomonas reidholzensis]
MNVWWLVPVIAGASLLITGLLRRYALSRSLIDVPNARSSHTVPTPRGGGVAIVLSFLVGLPIAWWSGSISLAVMAALAGAGGLVAVIGFMDDHGHIAARWRLLGHFVAAIWALFWLGGVPPLQVFGMHLDLGWLGVILAALYLVWMLNLYNFMDGIDGLASVQAMCAALGMGAIYLQSGHAELVWPVLSLGVAVAGFLFWNFPPAKIFMGDAGSGFLGFSLAVLSLQAAWADSQLFWSWLILMGVFIVDATLTLVQRLRRGQKVYEAHRTHAYQYASRRYGRHLPVTLAVLGINLLWLLPLAWAVAYLGLDGLIGVLVAYLPLLALAIKFDAGTPEAQ